MITWNIDPDNYTIEQLEALIEVAEQIDYSIATELVDYINNLRNTSQPNKAGI